MSPATLTSLPAELRCVIYDHLFSDLVVPHQLKADVYRLPDEWPSNDFSTYAALTLTCSLIHGEAVPYSETHFLPNLRLHFDSVYQLHRLSKSLSAKGPPYGSINFSLRTSCKLACLDFQAENADRVKLISKLHPLQRRQLHGPPLPCLRKNSDTA